MEYRNQLFYSCLLPSDITNDKLLPNNELVKTIDLWMTSSGIETPGLNECRHGLVEIDNWTKVMIYAYTRIGIISEHDFTRCQLYCQFYKTSWIS